MSNTSTRAIRKHRLVTAPKLRQYWDVYLDGKRIDNVSFAPSLRSDEVKASLIMHDGFNPCINVRKQS